MFEDHQSQGSPGNGRFQQVVKRAQRKTIFRTIIIAAIVSTVLIVLFLSTSNLLLKERIKKETRYRTSWYHIASPNIEEKRTVHHNHIFLVTETTTFIKEINNRPIPWDTVTREYGPFGKAKTIDPLWGETGSYNDSEKKWDYYDEKTGERALVFYHPSIYYRSFPQDLDELDNMDPNLNAEFSLSFDKPYTVKQVRNMILSDHLDWMWVDSYSERELKDRNAQTEPREVYTASSVYGFKSADYGPDLFMSSLHALKDQEPYAKKVAPILKSLKEKEVRSPRDLRVIGVIISGLPQDLKRYQNKPYIRASVLGATVEKY